MVGEVLVANAGASLEETPLATNIYDLPQALASVARHQCRPVMTNPFPLRIE